MGNLHDGSYKIYYNKYIDPQSKSKDNYSGPFVHPSVNNFDEDITKKYQNCSLIEKTLDKMTRFKDHDCLGYRKKISAKDYENKYSYYSYGTLHKNAKNFAKNLHERPDLIYSDTYEDKPFKLIGLFSKNCSEWVMTDVGCQLDSITTVTLYSTLGVDAFEYICNQTLISTMCVSPDLISMLVDCKTKFNLTSLKNVILFDITVEPTSEDLNKMIDCGLHVISFKKLIEENNSVKDDMLTLSSPDTVMTICYTSGTTGNPKGVMLTQRNMVSGLEICIRDSKVPLDENGAHMSFLPLAHIMERFVVSGYMNYGGRIGFLSGTIRETLAKDIEYLRPTLLFVVPRVMQTLRQKLFAKFDELPLIKRKMIYKGLEIKKKNYEKYGVITHSFFDQIIFKKIRDSFGGRLKVILCASAPLSKDLAMEFRLLLSIPIIEAWGMTELSGAGITSTTEDYTNYTCGGVISTSLMKLIDVPELNYTSQTVFEGKNCPSGEICIKGPAVCLGYYKNQKETQSTIDNEGFFHTGDIGRIIPHFNNGIRIIDRVKEIFKLSQGEYIIPNKLENVYGRSKYVAQILIYGNATKNHIIAIINPNKKDCCEFLHMTHDDPIEKIYNSPELEEEIRNDLLKMAEEAQFNSLEKVRYFILTQEEFSVDNGCLTPTLKPVRKKIEPRYKDQIEALYNQTEHLSQSEK